MKTHPLSCRLALLVAFGCLSGCGLQPTPGSDAEASERQLQIAGASDCGDKGEKCCGPGYFAACNGPDLVCSGAGICEPVPTCQEKCDPKNLSCVPCPDPGCGDQGEKCCGTGYLVACNSPDLVCTSGGTCEPTGQCSHDTDCLGDQFCSGGTCKPSPCGDKGQQCCGTGYFAACNGGDLVCTSAGICEGCVPGTSGCPTKCDAATDSCPSGQACVNGACQPCSSDTCAVPPPPSCGEVGQVCCPTLGSGTTSSGACSSGLNCIEGFCRTFCGGIASFPCKSGQVCLDDPTDTCDPKTGADCGGYCL